MRRVQIMLLAVVALNVRMAAQNGNKVEVFGGYSLEHVAPCGSAGGPAQLSCQSLELGDIPNPSTFNGWDASLTGYFKRYLGATANFSGVYGSLSGGSAGGASTSRYSYLFGPVLALRTQKATTFVHVLFGAVSQNAAPGGGFNYNGFTWAIGGGYDVGLTRRLALRVAQLDYEQVKVPNFGGPSAKGFRYSGGVVFRF